MKTWGKAGRLREQQAQRFLGEFYMLRSLKKASVYEEGGVASKSIGEVNGGKGEMGADSAGPHRPW